MSSVVIAGNTSGTITLDAPNVAGTTVLTLPTANGTVLTTANTFGAGTGPAFSAQTSTTQNISNATYTKVTLGTENFDTNNNFSSSTFTPTVAGYYEINAGIFYNGSITSGLGQIYIYKNGSSVNGTVSLGGTGGYCGLSISTLVYCNGSTDYIELYTYHSFGSTQPVSSGNTVFMTGFLARAA